MEVLLSLTYLSLRIVMKAVLGSTPNDALTICIPMVEARMAKGRIGLEAILKKVLFLSSTPWPPELKLRSQESLSPRPRSIPALLLRAKRTTLPWEPPVTARYLNSLEHPLTFTAASTTVRVIVTEEAVYIT